MSTPRYQIIRELGSGGMGKVYLVNDRTRPEQEFALKALSLKDPDEHFLECFKAEFEILSNLDHPHLAKVYDFTNRSKLLEDTDTKKKYDFADGAQYFFTSEFVPGVNLFKATENLDWKEICHLVIPLCRALAYIHSRGIVHRDLKPGNILVSDVSKKQLKVLDFGLARGQGNRQEILTDLKETTSSTIVGTLSYISPELIRGETLDGRADLYALGMILYRLFTRVSPFSGLNQRQIFSGHLEGIKTPPRQIIPELPRALNQLVMSLISPNVEERPQQASEVLAEIADLLGELAPAETVATSLGYVRSGKIVGRKEILEKLNQRVSALNSALDSSKEKAQTEEIKPLVLKGEAGLGKRRLITELERHCQLQAVPFIKVSPHEDDRPVATVRNVLSALVSLIEEGAKENQKSPEVRALKEWLKKETEQKETKPTDSLDDPFEALSPLRGSVTREITRAYEILTQYLSRIIALLPGKILVLHIPIQTKIFSDQEPEDLSGFFERSHLALFHHFERALKDESLKNKLFLILSAQPEVSFSDLKDFEIVNLKTLTKEQTKEFLQSMLGVEDLPAKLLDSIFQMTSGNPLHIEEGMRALVSEGALQQKAGKWLLEESSSEALAKMAVPQEVEQTLSNRYQNLDSKEKDVLNALAFLSLPVQKPIPAFAINAILSRDLPETLQVLEKCRTTGWIRGFGDYQYEFSSPSSIQVIEKKFQKEHLEDAKNLHLKVAQFLQKKKELQCAVLAYHFDQAKEFNQALPLYISAGMEASDHYAPRESLKYFQRAEEILSEFDENKRLEFINKEWFIEEQIARLLGIVGEPKEALKRYEDLVRQLEVLPPEQEPSNTFRSRIHRRLGHLHRSLGFPERALESYQKALALLGPKAAGREGALLLVQMAGVKGRMGRRAPSRRDCRFALQRIDADKEPLIYGTCYTVLGELELTRGQLELAEEYFHRALKSFERIEDREGIALVLSYLGSVLDRQGRSEDAEHHLRRAVREASAIGEVRRVAMARNNLGNLRFRRGDFPAALREYLAGVEAARRLGDRRLLATSLNNLGNVSRQRGSYGRSLEYYQESLNLKKELNDPRSLCHTLLAFAELELQIGDYGQANSRIQEAYHLARNCGAKDLEAQALMDLGIEAHMAGELAMSDRKFDEAKRIYQKENVQYGEINVELERMRLKAERNLLEAREIRKLTKLLTYAIEKGNIEFEAQAFLLLGLIEKQAEVSEAYLTLALQHAKSSGNEELQWEAGYRLGLSLNRSKKNVREGAGWTYIGQAKDILLEISTGLPPNYREIFLKHPLRKECLKTQIPSSAYDYSSPLSSHQSEDSEEKTGVFAEDRLYRLLQINKKLNAVHQVDQLLDQILDTSLELLSGERGFILMSSDGQLQVRKARHINKEKMEKPELEFSMSIAKEVVEKGKPHISMDAQNAPEFKESKSVHVLKLRSVLCVPLMVRGITLGALYLDNPKIKAMFTEDDVRLLMAFSDQAALALEQARMRNQLNNQLELTKNSLQGAREELSQVRSLFSREYRMGQIIGGRDSTMSSLFTLLKKVAKGQSPVLIMGESGTGKELVARAIHSEGILRDKPFLTLNCAAFPEGLLESELFGHEQGAFTGAGQKKIGLFEVAHEGTLFLDEIGEMSAAMQAKLLRVLETGDVRRVGGTDVQKVKVRLICATHRDLNQLVHDGKFRQDLLYRINTIVLNLPPLRDRPQDFPLLIDHIMKQLRKRFKSRKIISRKGMRFLERYDWPGNIRELSNVLERAYTLAEGRSIRPDDFPPEILEASSMEHEPSDDLSKTFKEAQSNASRSFLEDALKKARGNVSLASRNCGIPRGTFYRLMRRHGVHR